MEGGSWRIAVERWLECIYYLRIRLLGTSVQRRITDSCCDFRDEEQQTGVFVEGYYTCIETLLEIGPI
jgi:hypothetical protein